jgi:hypothetical protein
MYASRLVTLTLQSYRLNMKCKGIRNYRHLYLFCKYVTDMLHLLCVPVITTTVTIIIIIILIIAN